MTKQLELATTAGMSETPKPTKNEMDGQEEISKDGVKPMLVVLEVPDESSANGLKVAGKEKAEKGQLDLEKLINTLTDDMTTSELYYVISQTDSGKLTKEMKKQLKDNPDEARCAAENLKVKEAIAEIEQHKMLHHHSGATGGSVDIHNPVDAALNVLSQKNYNGPRNLKYKLAMAAKVLHFMRFPELKATKDGYEQKGYRYNGNLVKGVAMLALTTVTFGRWESTQAKNETGTLREYREQLERDLKAARSGDITNVRSFGPPEIYSGNAGGEPWSEGQMGDPLWALEEQRRQDETEKKKKRGMDWAKQNDNTKHLENPKDTYERSDKIHDQALGFFEGFGKGYGLENRGTFTRTDFKEYDLDAHHAVHKFLNSLELNHNYRLSAVLFAMFNGDYSEGQNFSDISGDKIEETTDSLATALDISGFKLGLDHMANVLEAAVNADPKPTNHRTEEGKAWMYFWSKYRGNDKMAAAEMRNIASRARRMPKRLDGQVKIAKNNWENECTQLTDIFNEGQVMNANGEPKHPPRHFTFRAVRGAEMVAAGYVHEVGVATDRQVQHSTYKLTNRDRATSFELSDVNDISFIEVRVHFENDRGEPDGHIVGYIDTRTGAPVGNKPI